VFSANGQLHPGINHIKLAVADTSDHILDSNVFIRGESFACGAISPVVFDPPSPCGQMLTGQTGVVIEFDVVALATNGRPDQGVVLTAEGVPDGATHDPLLPTQRLQPAMSHFAWSPTTGQVGDYVITY